MSKGERLWRAAFVFMGLVLVATGTGKILDLSGFTGVVEQYRLVSPAVAQVVTYTLPFVELATGLCLVSRLWLRAATASAVVLHLLLVGAVAVTLWRGIPVSNCGCFGVFLARPLGAQTAWRPPSLDTCHRPSRLGYSTTKTSSRPVSSEV